MNEEIEMNSRCEYPADRVLVDIIELLQAMATLGFCFSIGWRSHCSGSPLLCVDLWQEYNENNCHGAPDGRLPAQISPIISSTTVNGLSVGWCSYSASEFGSLHAVYDALFALYQKRRGAPEPLPMDF